MQEKKICPCCGANLTGRFERVSRGLANSLIKFRKQVVKNKVNKIHLANDLELSKNEYNNFQKLRYHGLIAHYKCKETKEFLTGYWLLTHRGNKFCKNELHVPKKLHIFRNKIVERSEERICLKEVMNDDEMPYWDERDDFGMNFRDVDDFNNDDDEDNQLDLFSDLD